MRTGTAGLLYLFGDHLGSTTVAANPDGTLNSKQLYMPFPQGGCFATLRDGESRYTSGNLPTDYKFTGQMKEPELGFYYRDLCAPERSERGTARAITIRTWGGLSRRIRLCLE
jgi:hypothetical protein